ncbi:MAG: pyridoxal 5'-phosphate synthase glutaminase subunit PdxT [Anaerolineales bacterium]|jgi:5'-phosphate synthase pdxT subunit
MKIGVLALQGDFAEHLALLRRLQVEGVEVRLPKDLEGLEGLIIPGGESTTIGKLATTFGLMEPLLAFGGRRAIWGTCAGAILLSKDAGRDQPLLGLMDISVERNAFGRQAESFEIELEVPVLDPSDRPFHAVFIRAPLIEKVGKGVEVLARLPSPNGKGSIVAARQGHLLATSFHPELTDDARFHQYFLTLVQEGAQAA